VTPDPRQIIQDLDLDLAAVQGCETVSERHGHALWRVVTGERSYVLKWLGEGHGRVEIEGYRLLQDLGVPTLPLYGSSDEALLLEDLARSDTWRLAAEADVAQARVGRAVARWYRLFHDAGEALLSQGSPSNFLAREIDVLDPETVLLTGRALGLADLPVWGLAADHVELLKGAAARLSLTLNYNDFYWTNLALSRREARELEAIVFDYHLLGMGMRYSDVRNVRFSLSGAAVPAFQEAYGPLDLREQILDRPLATLYNLYTAARMADFPSWAEHSRERVMTGALERDLREAIALSGALLE